MTNPTARLIETAKSIGVVLTTISGIAYACGYLVRRARAHALGLDPGFSLVDEAYVFAGFRFALLTLIALLVTAPFLLAIRPISRYLRTLLSPNARAFAEWLAVLTLALVTLFLFFVTLVPKDVLLKPASADRFSIILRNGILGQNYIGILMSITTNTFSAYAVYWVILRYRQYGTDPMALVLSAITGLLLVLLPLQHGVFWADRTVRTLERAPDSLTSDVSSVWMVDRSGDRVVLLIHDTTIGPKLVTLKADKLDGIAVTNILTLDKVVAFGEAQ